MECVSGLDVSLSPTCCKPEPKKKLPALELLLGDDSDDRAEHDGSVQQEVKRYLEEPTAKRSTDPLSWRSMNAD